MSDFIPSSARWCAGVLPFFKEWTIILLGQEFRQNIEKSYWMEFGGKPEGDETLAETAFREFREETAQTVNITLDQIKYAEQTGHYVDHYNNKTNFAYRMYCVKINDDMPDIETFKENAKHCENVNKLDWKYFVTSDVVFSENGSLPETDHKLYDTMRARLEKLKTKEFFRTLICPT
jgi:8-oxo-dGTP pyrophosphatase MutT (NUDIX family)